MMAAIMMNTASRVFIKSFWHIQNKTLYSASALGIDGYLAFREKINNQFQNADTKFRERMRNYLNSPSHDMIFTEDLKVMIHLIENKDDDLNLCLEMLKRFNAQNKQMRFGTYVFGPVLMRMFHYLGKPDIALKLLKEADYDGLFDQLSSFHILMDSLYKKEKYQDILGVFDLLKDRQLYGVKYPKDCVNLVMGACYKLNTKESFDYAISLLQGIREAGSGILRKGVTFASALALNQNNPSLALEILSLTSHINYVTVKNIRLIALAELDRLDNMISILTSSVSRDDIGRKSQILEEVIDKIRAAIARNGRKEFLPELDKLYMFLKDSNQLGKESLESILCSEIPLSKNRNLRQMNSSDNRNNFDRQYSRPMFQRKGLHDIDD